MYLSFYLSSAGSRACHAKGRRRLLRLLRRLIIIIMKKPLPPTPLQCTKSHACHAKATGSRAAETEGRQRDTGGTPGRTPGPFAVHQMPRLPRKNHRQSGGDQGTPETRSARTYIRPLGSAPSPAPATQKRPATKSVSVCVMYV